MCISAFQTHSEVGVGEEWGGWLQGLCGIFGVFFELFGERRRVKHHCQVPLAIPGGCAAHLIFPQLLQGSRGGWCGDKGDSQDCPTKGAGQ